MPTDSLGIKDSVTPSFKLILSPQKENFQIISAPKLTILVVQREVFLFPLLVIMCYCLNFFVTTNAFW